MRNDQYIVCNNEIMGHGNTIAIFAQIVNL